MHIYICVFIYIQMYIYSHEIHTDVKCIYISISIYIYVHAMRVSFSAGARMCLQGKIQKRAT